MKKLCALLVLLLPWPLRRRLLAWLWKYELHPTSRIGLSLVLADRLELAAGARIGHGNVIKGLALVRIAEHGLIGNLNWITGFPLGLRTRHFAHQPERRPELHIGAHAAVTHRHMIDCTHRVEIGAFSIFAGFRSQILTHSIDLTQSRQHSEPITIGAYCFVGTGCVLLGGAALPDRSVLGALSLLNKAHVEPGQLYAGVPARPVVSLPADARFFSRAEGYID
ncbi:MAG: acyltransferase [Verrucomicrobia bacterium]|nr:acyltransferase [Verrucomicrobiota bacterium]